jgi:hypothetical protein
MYLELSCFFSQTQEAEAKEGVCWVLPTQGLGLHVPISREPTKGLSP